VLTLKTSMLDPSVSTFVLDSLPPHSARVLEVGAGDGALAAVLTEAGYDVLAIDPASNVPKVRPIPLHELREPPGSFDAAVAVVSLHHVEPLVESCRVLAELVKPHGALILDEFDVERVDEQAATWWLHHRDDDHDHDGDTPAEIVAHLRAHCHTLSELTRALGPWFELEPAVRGPYLYRWARRLALREDEEQLIASGSLPATGVRITGIRSTTRPH
jgi:SAM-dependent methyltransferase